MSPPHGPRFTANEKARSIDGWIRTNERDDNQVIAGYAQGISLFAYFRLCNEQRFVQWPQLLVNNDLRFAFFSLGYQIARSRAPPPVSLFLSSNDATSFIAQEDGGKTHPRIELSFESVSPAARRRRLLVRTRLFACVPRDNVTHPRRRFFS